MASVIRSWPNFKMDGKIALNWGEQMCSSRPCILQQEPAHYAENHSIERRFNLRHRHGC
jgi:hypothetical protein